MGESARLLVAFAVLCAGALLLMAPSLEAPGLYYDEVVQAEPSVALLSGVEPAPLPGSTHVRLLGRSLPWMTQPYMGALKSQLLLPSLAVFGAGPGTLRLTTLAWVLAGVLCAMGWALRALSLPAALIAGALLTFDPGLLFLGRHDWGSFALGFLCRCAALLLLTSGWQDRSTARLAWGGLFLGLGLYNKIDFALFPIAGGFALLCAVPGIARQAARERRPHLIALALGAGLGAAPLMASLGAALGTARQAMQLQRAGVTDGSEKLATLAAALDGSYFHRLMLAGGSFESLPSIADAASNPAAVLVPVALLALAVSIARDPGRAPRAHVFLLLATLGMLLGLLATPRAVRLHHALNLLPLPQLATAAVAAMLWRWQRPGRALVRAGVALAVCCIVAGQIQVVVRTNDTIRSSGGRGLWSNALQDFGAELSADPEAVAVSLDWGFDRPLRFGAPLLATREPIWRLNRLGRGAAPSHRIEGTRHHVYLAFEPEFSVFPYGGQLLAALERSPEGGAEIRRHHDREGRPAFRSIRLPYRHTLVYRCGGVEVRRR